MNQIIITQQEHAAVCYVAKGLPHKALASEMKISIKTVEKHIQGAMRKLNIHDRASLAHYALAANWVDNIYAGTATATVLNKQVGRKPNKKPVDNLRRAE